jgi:hypothetical protein
LISPQVFYTCGALLINAIRIIDMNFWAGLFDYKAAKLFNGLIICFMIKVVLDIVKSWVSIVDGGKTKTTPPWIISLGRGMMALLIFCEVPLAVLESVLVPFPRDDKYEGSFSGVINSLKGIGLIVVSGTYAYICTIYGNKITAQLASGGSGSGDANKKLVKYMKSATVALSLGVLYKLAFLLLRINKPTIYENPPCAAGFVDVLSLVYIVIPIIIMNATNPNSKAINKVAPNNKSSTTTSTSSESSAE